MSLAIEKTIHLMKRSYNQPIIFHMLHSHMVHLISNSSPLQLITDDWSKVIILSCHTGKGSNQGLETKMIQLLKRQHSSTHLPAARLKLMLVCYYIMNSPVHTMNHFIVFELATNHMGISPYFDGLIIGIVSRITTAHIFSFQTNRRIREDSLEWLVKTLLEKKMSLANRIKLLGVAVNHKDKPASLAAFELRNDFISYKFLEYAFIYAKYTDNIAYIKEILPSSESFVEGLKSYMQHEYTVDHDANSLTFTVGKMVLEDRSLYDYVQSRYDKAEDKSKFIADLLKFINNLE